MDWGAFLREWQNLIGAALGPFLAVILSAIGYWCKSKIEAMHERKEAHRRIEIAVARSLNDNYILRTQLQWFAGRVKKLAAEARTIINPKEYFLSRINFPSMREIYRDQDMARFKVRSYYIHNKLLFLDAGIKETNETVAMLKNDFEEIIRQNGLLVAVMRDHPNPPAQRDAYAANLDAYTAEIENYISRGINQGIKIMVQVRVYNRKLREKHGYWVWRKYEGTWMKYFRTKAEQKAFARHLDSLDSIDAAIESEVQEEQRRADERRKKLFADSDISSVFTEEESNAQI